MNGQSGSYNGKHGSCTYCGRYPFACDCMSEREITLLKGIHYFAGLYYQAMTGNEPEVGSLPFVMNYVKNMEIEHSNEDFIRAGLIETQ